MHHFALKIDAQELSLEYNHMFEEPITHTIISNANKLDSRVKFPAVKLKQTNFARFLLVFITRFLIFFVLNLIR